MKVLCVFGRYNYGDSSRGTGYEYSNFIPTLKRLGHETHFLESRVRSSHANFIELNRTLLRRVEELRPDVVLAVLTCYELWLETWQILRDSGIAATVNWTTDDSWKYPQFSRFLASSFHAFTTTYSEKLTSYHKDGSRNVLLTQWGANSANLKPPRPARSCQHAVTFIGTAHGKRKSWIEAAQKRGVDITCYGYGWPKGPLATDDIPRVVNDSVISLNFANGACTWNGLWFSEKNQIKARTFEVPGAGGFLLTEDAIGLGHFYHFKQEIDTFTTINELVRQVRYYLDHPNERDEMAQAGFERTCRDHTYERRLKEVLEFALEQQRQYCGALSARGSGAIDWTQFEHAARRHTLNLPLKALKHLLVVFSSAVWGRERGPRAARRLLYELSWRLAGRRTYSAAGWPGRLFYEAS